MNEPKRWLPSEIRYAYAGRGDGPKAWVAAEDYDRLREERDEIARQLDTTANVVLPAAWRLRDEARESAAQLAAALRSMPDAGFTDADPRWEWWHTTAAAALAVFDAKENR